MMPWGGPGDAADGGAIRVRMPRMAERKQKRIGNVLLALFFLWMGVTQTVGAEEKQTIGLVENVVLMPWKIKIPARIDTGAAYTSLDARELKIQDNIAEFKLPWKYGGAKIRLPVIGWQSIRSAEARERRPVVEMDLCIGSRFLRAKVNLNNRSLVRYPMIVGRNILKENFVVDCMQEHCAPPSCPEEPSR
jgi:hypothetical protein